MVSDLLRLESQCGRGASAGPQPFFDKKTGGSTVKGLDFQLVFEYAEWFEFTDSLSVRALRLTDLLEAKRAAARPKDLDDLENLS